METTKMKKTKGEEFSILSKLAGNVAPNKIQI
jgi:hypothetical protein